MKLTKICSGYCCLLGTSVLFIIAGIVLIVMRSALFALITEDAFVLTPASKPYEVWQRTPFPLAMDFYLFNWTNPEDVYNASVKPRFVQMGPYRFMETKEKVNLTWNTNGTVTFKHLKRWYVDGSSNLQDMVTTVNPVALTAAYTARDWNLLVKKGMSMSLPSKIHITKTVGEMLFDGYQDPLITLGRSMPFLSNIPPWDKFGWFYTRNGSIDFDGIFNMGTGEGGTTFGKLYEWKHRNRTDYFPGDCGLLKGSAGELFPPQPLKTNISFFSADLCRSVTLDYVEESNIHNIIGYKFAAGASLLDNGTNVPENGCYCTGECQPSGAVNVSSCRFGSPSFVSLPHFHNADPYYTNLIEGLKADKERHEFFITLEPNTGIPLEVAARLQINLLVQPIKFVGLYQNAPRMFVPMLWFEQVVRIPNEMASMLRLLLNMTAICLAIGVLSICVGLVLAVCLLYRICTANICGKKKDKRRVFAEQMPLTSEKANQK